MTLEEAMVFCDLHDIYVDTTCWSTLGLRSFYTCQRAVKLENGSTYVLPDGAQCTSCGPLSMSMTSWTTMSALIKSPSISLQLMLKPFSMSLMRMPYSFDSASVCSLPTGLYFFTLLMKQLRLLYLLAILNASSFSGASMSGSLLQKGLKNSGESVTMTSTCPAQRLILQYCLAKMYIWLERASLFFSQTLSFANSVTSSQLTPIILSLANTNAANVLLPAPGQPNKFIEQIFLFILI